VPYVGGIVNPGSNGCWRITSCENGVLQYDRDFLSDVTLPEGMGVYEACELIKTFQLSESNPELYEERMNALLSAGNLEAIGIDVLTNSVVNNQELPPTVVSEFGWRDWDCPDGSTQNYHTGIDVIYNTSETITWEPTFNEVLDCMVYDGTSQEIGAHVLLVSFRDEFGGVYTMRIEHASAASCEDGISLTLGNEGASSGSHYHIDMVSGNVIPQIEGQSDTVEAVRDYFVPGPCTSDPENTRVPTGYINPYNYCTETLLQLIEQQNSAVPDSGVILQTKAAAGNSTGYSFYDIQNKEYVTTKTSRVLISDDKANIEYFVDINRNGLKDKDEPVIDSEKVTLKLKKTSDAFVYNLNAGWNLVAFPFGNERKASDIIEYSKIYRTEIVHIAKYTGGDFQIYTNRGDQSTYSNDFYIKPDESYFVFVKKAGKIIFDAKLIIDPVPLTMSNGWNLVAINAGGKNYKAFQLLDELNKQTFQADTISKYENGKYTSVIKESSTNYGNDFSIQNQQGYFIKINKIGEKTSFTP